jgi:cystathionine gamma-lyase
VGTPIYQNSTFLFPRRRDEDGHWVDNADWMYTRQGNPTVAAVEQKVAALEGAEAALAFSSGMAAIASSVVAFAGQGEGIVAMSEVYGGTVALFNDQFKAMGLSTTWVEGVRPEALVEACTESTRVVYLEMPTNPFNRCLDVRAVVRMLGKRFGRNRPKVLIDATFASPVNYRPLEDGVDLVIHSATKYLNGHSDVIAGVVAGSKALVDRVRVQMKNLGGSMDPHAAFLLARGLKTLPLRMRAHNANAHAVAQALESMTSKVEQVWYPSLESHPDHRVARRLMSGYGGIVTFRLKSAGSRAARRVLEALELFYPAPSLGGVESLASIPSLTSHAALSPAARKRLGITPSVIRLAVGVEDVDDLVTDLRRGLKAA